MGTEREPQRTTWRYLVWVIVGLFWYVTTRDFHLTTELAVIVTASLVVAFAVAVDVNHLVLIPRYWRSRRYGTYAAFLFGTMAILTAIALTVIRVSYFRLHGPDADPYGMYKHFVIDLFGVAVHVAAAAGIVWIWRRTMTR
ncbi:hypothetical protein VT84_10230 [Gemmata sp. SH-PL17]|uniref:hypothetical protein n=1 Tax=Gemmata sp. SH-PL17 TaxID=1630693 RepID=UPI00078B557A|nr:hypothetical protein [Gemmata sp. SH-PL17]AMV24763.1 hypothetical protein VT84_10230 [Gemmata sp. SH-PL17]